MREFTRRRWDRLAQWIRASDLNSTWSTLSEEQRATHRARSAALRAEAGIRP